VIVLCIYFYKQMNTPVNCGFKWETLLVLLSKSWKSGAFSILYTDFLPIPKKEEVVSHPERACAAGRTLHVISEREEYTVCS
jgi:hypothetical protein